ncbi:unnamed protein product [Parascedosporium putredinis]|uniref:Uncharacterized protein n=1 Tax=Parascedosporium putredinis TaxID=1442378 RepID=A0A9P1HAS0_9PEZI|nr:unnamed protein product [Parascedosporium putredinis]CAI8002370.1 unnamed protein product [Parascedosporium putredinis]
MPSKTDFSILKFISHKRRGNDESNNDDDLIPFNSVSPSKVSFPHPGLVESTPADANPQYREEGLRRSSPYLRWQATSERRHSRPDAASCIPACLGLGKASSRKVREGLSGF